METIKIKDFEKFSDCLHENIKPLINKLSTDSEHRNSLREHIRGLLLDEGGKAVPSAPSKSKPDDFLTELSLRFFEIKTTLEHLRDFEIYISIFPYRKKGIPPIRYLVHTIGTYLNEVYIFKERLRSFLNFLKNRYKKDTVSKKLKSEVHLLHQTVLHSLGRIVLVRTKHVHEKRYDGPDLERLTLLSILENNNDIQLENNNDIRLFQYMYKEEFNELRKKWKKTISKNNSEIEKLLDICFGRLYEIIFDNGKLIYPDATKEISASDIT